MNTEYWLKPIYDSVVNINKDMIDVWSVHIVFAWRWWLGILQTIIPWIIWIKIRDKKHTGRLLLVGLLVAIISESLDNVGLCLGFWYYEWKPTPVIPNYVPWNFALFPVSIMLLLQFKSNQYIFIKAISFALFSAFICEPFYHWLGIYMIKDWKYWYSFVIYIPLFLLYSKIYNCKHLRKFEN